MLIGLCGMLHLFSVFQMKQSFKVAFLFMASRLALILQFITISLILKKQAQNNPASGGNRLFQLRQDHSSGD